MPTREEIVFAAAISYFKRMLNEYGGRPENLKEWLLKRLERFEERKEEILANVIDSMA